MKFGFFDDNEREYVITTPRTPWPWINYLGAERLFSLISNTAGGYCFYRDARFRRITRYRYNSVPRDNTGRYFYIHDNGDYWSPGWKPVRRELDHYECRHGAGYTTIAGERGGVRCEARFFVPLGVDAELHRVTVTNLGDVAKSVTLFSCVEWCLWNALDDLTNFQRNLNTGEVAVEGSAIYHLTEYRERRNHFAYYAANVPVAGTDTDRDTFLGADGDYGAPAAVVEGRSRGSVADGWSPIASHGIELRLEPGRSRTVVFVLGYAENPAERKWVSPGEVNTAGAQAVIERFAAVDAVDSAFEELREYWRGLLDGYRVETHEPRIDRMVNTWNQYQCMVTFNLSRSASYFESGIGRGLGFRDSNQDLLGFVHQVPERARERLIDLAATQLESGGAYHQYQPLTKRGNDAIGGDFNDDPLWLILAVAAYVKETGDRSILDERVPFDTAPAASIHEHLRRAFHHVAGNLGPHGLPLIGRADWNDCLNLNCFSTDPDDSFQTCVNKDGRAAESVMIAGLLVVAGRELAGLWEWYAGAGRSGGSGLDPAKEAARVRECTEAMARTIRERAWDGAWFLRAYDDGGAKVGGRECEEGRIFIESQGWCAMAGVGREEGLVERALDSVGEHLGTVHGLVLVNPPYSRYRLELGEISSYPPGYKENAGIFCHNNPWIAIGETVIGRGERAFECWRAIAPSYREDIAEVHRMEPYVYAQMIAGKDARRHGEAKNSWLTGTASWSFVAISQYILGVRPSYEGLVVEPCIPSDWPGFTVRRRFRGAVYRIRVTNPDRVSKGVRSMTVDGEEVAGGIVPVYRDGAEHVVEVVMGT